MSFDEFHAVQKRMRARKQEENARKQHQHHQERQVKSGKKVETDGEQEAAEEEAENAKAGLTVGAFLEMQETQTVVILVALMDILVAIVQVILQSRGLTQTDTTAQWLLHNVLQVQLWLIVDEAWSAHKI